ncbi:MAG: YggT family protein [bacterium]
MRSIIYLINTATNVLTWLIIIRSLLTWIAPNVHDVNLRKLLTILYKITEPILAPIRRYLPSNSMGIDFSPIIAIFVLMLLNSFLVRLITYIFMDLGL